MGFSCRKYDHTHQFVSLVKFNGILLFSCRKYDHTHQLACAIVSIISNRAGGGGGGLGLISWALEELAIKLHKPPGSPFQFSNQTMLPTLAVDV